MSADFVHLHTHSSYSPMWGLPTLEALCQAARAQGQDTLALTDTNGLYGAIRFLEVAKHSGLKPILGAELVHRITELYYWPSIQTAMPTCAACCPLAMRTPRFSSPWRTIGLDW